MGVILQGILGGFSGKVGPVVGAKWKDIDYMRGYVIPANPNTAGQQTVRAKFAYLVALARLIIPTVLQPYWDRFYTDMSGFNAWISKNYALASSTGELGASAIMAKGTLETVPIISCVYTAGTGNCVVTYDTGTNGNGLATDNVLLVMYNKTTDLLQFFEMGVTRADGSVTGDIAINLSPANVFAYIFAYRGTGPSLEVSDSTGSVSSAP